MTTMQITSTFESDAKLKTITQLCQTQTGIAEPLEEI